MHGCQSSVVEASNFLLDECDNHGKVVQISSSRDLSPEFVRENFKQTFFDMATRHVGGIFGTKLLPLSQVKIKVLDILAFRECMESPDPVHLEATSAPSCPQKSSRQSSRPLPFSHLARASRLGGGRQ